MKMCFLLTILGINVAVDAFEDTWEGRQNFPPTKTQQFVHSLCAIGFESVSATSDNSILTYEPVEEWNDEEPLWLDRDYVGDGSLCKGGTYLKPSKHDQTPPGTNIAIKGSDLL
jgi:hypothetical protein